MIKKWIIILFCIFHFGIGKVYSQKDNIVLFKNGDGLYHYDLTSSKSICLLKINCDQGFIASQSSPNEITFGFDTKYNRDKEIIYDCYRYSKNGLKKEKIISYKYSRNNLTLVITKSLINDTILSVYNIDTINNVYIPLGLVNLRFYKNGKYFSDLDFNFDYNNPDNDFFSEKLNLYKIDKNDTILFLKKTIRDTIVSGYDFPVKYSKSKMIASYYEFNKKNHHTLREALVEINIRTKKTTFLKEEEFEDLKLSSDNRYIIFTRNNQKESDCSEMLDVFIWDIQNKQETYIGEASSAFWIKE